MSGHVIMVDFTLKPGAMAEFRRLIDANAGDSCRLEKGCRRFDVLTPAERGDRVVLYEIYDDRGAFAHHLTTAHFHLFDKAAEPLVLAKTIAAFDLVCEGSAAPPR